MLTITNDVIRMVNMNVLKTYRIWWMSLLFVFLIGASLVSAHAALLRTTPSDGEVVKSSPQKIALAFSEQLEPDLTYLRKKSPTSKREGAEAPVKVGDEFRLGVA
jgi:copper transport protein